VVLYQDDLKLFFESEMSKITWWKELSFVTQNELIFNMEREEHQAGSYLCKSGDKAAKLYLI